MVLERWKTVDVLSPPLTPERQIPVAARVASDGGAGGDGDAFVAEERLDRLGKLGGLAVEQGDEAAGAHHLLENSVVDEPLTSTVTSQPRRAGTQF